MGAENNVKKEKEIINNILFISFFNNSLNDFLNEKSNLKLKYKDSRDYFFNVFINLININRTIIIKDFKNNNFNIINENFKHNVTGIKELIDYFKHLRSKLKLISFPNKFIDSLKNDKLKKLLNEYNTTKNNATKNDILKNISNSNKVKDYMNITKYKDIYMLNYEKIITKEEVLNYLPDFNNKNKIVNNNL